MTNVSQQITFYRSFGPKGDFCIHDCQVAHHWFWHFFSYVFIKQNLKSECSELPTFLKKQKGTSFLIPLLSCSLFYCMSNRIDFFLAYFLLTYLFIMYFSIVYATSPLVSRHTLCSYFYKNIKSVGSTTKQNI